MLAEAVALCEKAGVDAAHIPECLAGGYAGSNLPAGVRAASAIRKLYDGFRWAGNSRLRLHFSTPFGFRVIPKSGVEC